MHPHTGFHLRSQYFELFVCVAIKTNPLDVPMTIKVMLYVRHGTYVE